jgi:hypothetical protein
VQQRARYVVDEPNPSNTFGAWESG